MASSTQTAPAIDWSAVGARIKAVRRARGLTQGQLGEPLASASLVSLVESGRRHASSELLDHVAARLDVEIEELMSGTSPRTEVELEIRLQEARDELRLGHLPEAEAIARDVAARAEKEGYRRIAARSQEIQGGIDERRNALDSALERYQRAEGLWQTEPLHLRYETVAGIARCNTARGMARFGIHVLEKYLHELEDDGVLDPRAAMRTYATLVICYSAVGLPGKAAEAADRAQGLAPRVSDPEQLACMCMNVARSLFDRGRIADALDALRQAEQAFLSLGWETDAARAKLNRAIVQIEKGELEEARRNLSEAVATFKRTGILSEAAKALDELGRLERLEGNVEAAEIHLREAATMLDHAAFGERALNTRELGLCQRDSAPERAQSALRRAIDLFVLAGDPSEVALTYRLLGDIHRACGELDEAADAYRAGLEAIEARPADAAG